MLILPFTGAFGQTSQIQRLVYFGAFLCATAATGLLIAPSAYHRLLFRQGERSGFCGSATDWPSSAPRSWGWP
jgi:hypothetical protein